ncbi:unnamed protein product, partial [Meganyctiphanes norvegica]
MSVGYNVSEGSMDFNSGTNLTSGIQDRCCSRWWRSRNGFERWMVIVVIIMGMVILALSVAVGVLDHIAYPPEPEPTIIDPVVEVRNLFDHMEEQASQASQLMEDTHVKFNQTLLFLNTVKNVLSRVDGVNGRRKKDDEENYIFERIRRDANSTENGTAPAPITTGNGNVIENGTDPKVTDKTNEQTTPKVTTQAPATVKVNNNTGLTTQKPAIAKPTTVRPTTNRSNNNGTNNQTTPQASSTDKVNGTNNQTTPAPSTDKILIEKLRQELNETGHNLTKTKDSLYDKIIELKILNETLQNTSLVLDTKIEMLANKSKEIDDLLAKLNDKSNTIT